MTLDRRIFLKLSAAAALAAWPVPALAEMRNGMPYRALGHTGVKVSLLCMGGSHIGRNVGEAEAIRILRTAVDEGVNFWDNAWHYNEGESELRMDKARKDGYREKVILMTKHKGRDAEAAQEYFDSSLKRLDVDSINLEQFIA